MDSNSKKKKKSLLHQSPVKQNTEGNSESSGSQENSKTNKKIWTSDALLKQMEPTAEEMEYRKRKLESGNAIEKCSRYLKCTKCQVNFKPLSENINKIAVHSFLKVLFCKECLHFYEDGEFSVDSDGEEKYCRWCGEGGLIYSCSECISGFCTTCIKTHFGAKYNGQVKKNSNWKCFFCFPKPLWYLRFICFIAQEETNIKVNVGSPSSNVRNALGGDGSSKLKDYNAIQSSSTSDTNANPSRKFGDEECSISSVLLSDAKESSEVFLNTPVLKRGIKRKHIIYSSSDESDDLVLKQKVKKAKKNESPGENSNQRYSDQNFVSSEIMDRLEKILRLAEYQMSFGVSWSSKMLAKLFKPDSVNTSEEIKSECQKIKWFFSILSTYLVESCSSVDLIEKSIETRENKIIGSPEKNQLGDYSSVVKFLDFVTNQVKVFLEKGIRLQDLLEGEIYYDNQIIGVKVKSNASNNTSGSSQAVSPKKSFEKKIIDFKMNDEEKTSDDESSIPALEVEGDRDSSETDMSKKLNLSDTNFDYIEVEDQKSKIQEILSILENA